MKGNTFGDIEKGNKMHCELYLWWLCDFKHTTYTVLHELKIRYVCYDISGNIIH